MKEADLQRATSQYFAAVLRSDTFAFHVPNEGKRGWRAQRAFKQGGGVAGVPDWCIVFCGRTYFIELKAARGRLSDAQKTCHPRIWEAGAPVGIAKSVDDVRSLLAGWNIPTREAQVRAA